MGTVMGKPNQPRKSKAPKPSKAQVEKLREATVNHAHFQRIMEKLRPNSRVGEGRNWKATRDPKETSNANAYGVKVEYQFHLNNVPEAVDLHKVNAVMADIMGKLDWIGTPPGIFIHHVPDNRGWFDVRLEW